MSERKARGRPCADIRRNRIQRAPRRHPLRRIPWPTLSELLSLGSCVRGATLNFFDAIEFFFGPIERMNLLVKPAQLKMCRSIFRSEPGRFFEFALRFLHAVGAQVCSAKLQMT